MVWLCDDWLALSWRLHGSKIPKKFLHRISLCGIVNVLRHTESTFNVFFKLHLNVTWWLWSPLSRCSIQKECALGLLARSWISMGDGPQQCPSMTLTPPEISISADIKVKSASLHVSVTAGIQHKCLFYFGWRISLMSVIRSVAFETLQKFLHTRFAQVWVILNLLLQFWLMAQCRRGCRMIFTCQNICVLVWAFI